MFMSMAESAPEKTPTTYTPIMVASASVVTHVYVIETSRAVAIDTERPGIAPTKRPASAPAKHSSMKRISVK